MWVCSKITLLLEKSNKHLTIFFKQQKSLEASKTRDRVRLEDENPRQNI